MDIKKFAAYFLFFVIGFITLQIPINQIMGTDVNFSFFDSFAILGGAFLGSVPGVIAVISMRAFDGILNGNLLETATLLRFLPIIFGVIAFKYKGRFTLLIPAVSAAFFIAHPIGREVWYFALLWTVPYITYFLRDKFLFARSLGATFTQHSVGGAAFIWAFAIPAEVWISLIPIVIVERFLLAGGITLFYLLFNKAFSFLNNSLPQVFEFNLEKKLTT